MAIRKRAAPAKGPVRRYQRKKRTQRVKFRRRYARSVLSQSLINIWSMVKITLFVFIISVLSIKAWQFWNTSPLLKISDVVIKDESPTGFRKFLPVERGDNIILLNTWKLEEAIADQFPQMAEVTVRRKWDRSVVIAGQFRRPLATLGASTSKMALDPSGTVFPLDAKMTWSGPLPHLAGSWNDPQIERVAFFLSSVKNHAPDFYLLINHIKTDRIDRVMVALLDGIVIYWGVLNSQQDLNKAKKVKTLLSKFKPVRRPATIRFVEENRIVLDRRWEKAS